MCYGELSIDAATAKKAAANSDTAIVVIGSQKLFRLGRNRRTSSMLAARRRDQELIAEAALGSANDRPCLGIRHRHRSGGGAQGIDGVKALASAAGFVVLFIYAIQAVAYVKVFFVDKVDE